MSSLTLQECALYYGMKAFIPLIMLLLAGCAAGSAGSLSIEREEPLAVWAVDGGFAPALRVVYSAPGEKPKTVLDAFAFPVEMNRGRREVARFRDWTISYRADIDTDMYGGNPTMAVIVELEFKERRDLMHLQIPFDPQTAGKRTVIVKQEVETGKITPPPEVFTTDDVIFTFEEKNYGDQHVLNIKVRVVNPEWGIEHIAFEHIEGEVIMSLTPGLIGHGAARELEMPLRWLPGSRLYFQNRGQVIYAIHSADTGNQ